MKPEKKFHTIKMRKDKPAAISALGVNAAAVIP
jgi:hypothetical protein